MILTHALCAGVSTVRPNIKVILDQPPLADAARDTVLRRLTEDRGIWVPSSRRCLRCWRVFFMPAGPTPQTLPPELNQALHGVARLTAAMLLVDGDAPTMFGEPEGECPMMNSRDDLPLSLRMPLRDIVRGMTGIAGLGEKAVRNVLTVLPQPFETSLRSAIVELEAAATRFLKADITQGEICRATRFVVGEGDDAHCCLRVLAYGWEQLQTSRRNTPEMFSETIAATRLAFDRKTGTLDTGIAHACGLFDVLRRSGAIGLPPGLPVQRSAAEQAEVDVNLFAVMLWLLAVRPETLVADQSLLELSAVLTEVHRAAVISAIGNAEALAFQFASLSEQL